mgnify:CR=1 FL=1
MNSALICVAAFLYNAAIVSLLWAWLSARAEARGMEAQLRRLMDASIDLNVALDQFAAEAEAPEEVWQKNTKEVVEKVNSLRLQLQSADAFFRE